MAAIVTTGKTHIKHGRLLIDGNNLSGDSRSLANIGLSAEQVDVSGWVDIMENIAGQKTVSFGDYSALFNNKVSAPSINAGTHTVLSSILQDFFGSFAIGISESPTIGAPVFSSSLDQYSYTATAVTNDAVAISATFAPGESAVAGWGSLLSAGVSQSATIDLTSLDNGAAATNGYTWIYHVSQSVGAMGANDWDLTIEDSAADAVFAATAGAVTGIGATVTSGILTDATSVDQFTRVSLVKNAGTDLVLWVAQIAL